MGLGSFLKKTVGTIGGGIVGGLLGGPVGAIAGASIGNAYDSSKATDKQNALAQSQYDQNVALQKEFAQNSMQWRVDDAKKAGLHPMAALGIQGSSFTPLQTIGYAQDNSASNLMNAISDMGQSVNYASTKAKDNQQQQVAVRLAQEGVELQNEGLRLDNEYKRWQLLQAMETGTSQALRSPSAPPTAENNLISGQGDSPFMDKPIVQDGWLLDEKGRKVGIIPSEDLADRTEDKFIIEWLPWGASALRAAKAKFLGQEVAGHWWHGNEKGFLPYPPKKTKGFFDYAKDAFDYYRDY